MVLPNTNTGVPPVTPNLGVNQPNRDGINANALANTNNVNKVMVDTLKGIEAKLGNITNLKTNVQSSVFEAFGNNFMTRSTSALIDGVTDAFDKFFETPEEVKDDPIVTILKQHTELLTKQNDTSVKLLELTTAHNDKLDTELISVSNIMGEQSKRFDTLIELMTDIFSGALEHNKVDDTPDSIGTDIPNDTPYVYDVNEISDANITAETTITKPSKKGDEFTPIQQIDPNMFDDKLSDVTDVVPIKRKSTEETKTPAIGFLSQIVKKLTEMGDSLKLLANGPLSTQENDLESKRKLDFIGPPKPSSVGGNAALAIAAASDEETEPPTSEGRSSWMDTALVAGGGLLTKAKSLLPKAGNLLKKAAAPVAAGLSVYEGISDIGDGKKVDSMGDIVPEGWDKLNPFSWAMKGGAYAGNKINEGYGAISNVLGGSGTLGSDLYDMFNTTKDAQPISKTNDISFEKNAEAKADEIEQKQKEIKESEKKSTKDVTIAPTNNTVNNNTTVLPTRTVVKNQEVSYNRYLDSVLA